MHGSSSSDKLQVSVSKGISLANFCIGGDALVSVKVWMINGGLESNTLPPIFPTREAGIRECRGGKTLDNLHCISVLGFEIHLTVHVCVHFLIALATIYAEFPGYHLGRDKAGPDTHAFS